MSYATKINLAIPPVFPYLVYMTIKDLKEIIALNIDAAEAGSLQAQGQVIEAQAEIERLELVAFGDEIAFEIMAED